MKIPKIILVDDHKIFRQGLKSLIIDEGIGDVIAEASNGKIFLDIIETHEPDLILMDIFMPEMNGIEATIQALEKKGNLRIIALTSLDEIEYHQKMINAGVKGIILKNSDIKELELAIQSVYQGGNYFSSNILQRIIVKQDIITPNTYDLTKREIEVINLICKSLTVEEIAKELCLSPETIKGHKSKIFQKIGCRNSAGLVIFAIKNKIINI